MRIPVATYRLQINDDFTLVHARAVVPYLAHVGITDLYLSPVFEARAGSTHGYDVTDPTRIRESVGGIEALRELAREAQRHHMGILLDIVPNHMAATVENDWWRDVLRNGRDSAYATFFDIDWGTPEEPRRLPLPILGDELDEITARGEIAIDEAEGSAVYFDHRFPLAAGTASKDVSEALARQHYELVPWWTASENMGYRRFFDITDLAGLRVEIEEVFEATHSLIRDLARDGVITGVRIDHIDGLRHPARYLKRLREFVRGPDGEPLYTVVEKILAADETIPATWQCEGTTGYEFLRVATALLIHEEGQARIDTFYRRITGDTRQFHELVREKKLLVMERLFGGELKSLASMMAHSTDVEFGAARRAIAEVTASMQVYRTYTSERSISAVDRRRIEDAVSDALQRTGDGGLQHAIHVLRRMMLLERMESGSHDLEWVLRWQQFSGPVMAKGFEDTALYCHNAMLAANDVGSDPDAPGMSVETLHAELARRQGTGALSLNATATHDTKRGEDTRARIAVLTEMPEEWRKRLRRWIREGDEWKNEIAEEEDTVAPAADVDSLLYQTLLGAWPLDGVDDAFRERVKTYMTKAVREAKEQTSWRKPDEDYEQALGAFIERLMAEIGREGLAEEIGDFAQRIAPHGALNSIAQMLLKVTAPGIPDFYQGTELWSLTLVDPDNRKAVDFTAHVELFEAVAPLRDSPERATAKSLLESWQDGRVKQLLTGIALRFRATHREVFEQGAVEPLHASGPAADHVFAFARTLGARSCITLLPRWTASLGGSTTIPCAAWRGTSLSLPPQLRHNWHNAITGETFPAGSALDLEAVFASVPFALLEISQPVGA